MYTINQWTVSPYCSRGGGEGSIPTQTQSAKICPNLHWGGGGGGGPDQLKPKVPRSVQICIWGRGCPDQHS